MRTACRQFAAIARITAAQEYRQPVLLLITVCAATAVLLLPVLIAHQFGEDGKLVRDSALALFFVFGLPFCVFAADSLRRERASGTAAITLTKAIRPEFFFVAKFSGLAALTAGYAAAMTAAVLLADRIAPRMYLADLRMYRILTALAMTAVAGAGLWNLLARRSFCAAAWIGCLLTLGLAVVIAARTEGAAAAGLTFARPLQWRIVPAGILIGAALLVFTAIAAALSARVKPAVSVVLCFFILLAGMLAEHALDRLETFPRTAAAACRLLPNWQHFWSADWLTEGGVLPAALITNALAYAGLYTIGVLALGVACWRHTEIN